MLKICVNKQIGKRKYIFQFEGQNLFDVLMESQTLSFPDIQKCKCGSDNLILKAHKAQDKFKYIAVRCLKCKASVNLGKSTDGKTYFLNPDNDGNYNWKDYQKPER